MKPFAYLRPASIDDAIAAIRDGARPLAGGTDLLTLMKADIEAPPLLVDVKRLPALGGGIRERNGGIEIGASTPLAAIETHAALAASHTALVQAVAASATLQLRNMATLGGNLLQQPRCWYFRHPHVRCWRKGGGDCPARDGENRLHAVFARGHCHAVHPSDPAAALTALGARLRLRGPAGARELPIEQLYGEPEPNDRREVRLAPDELITSVWLPAAMGPSLYLKAMDRKTWAFALVSVAAQAGIVDGRIATARIVLGGVAPVPWRVPAAEDALVAGEPPSHVAAAALTGAAPLSQNGYKLPIVRALVKRAAESLRHAVR
jgi:xanthine dehydrogenase YagS FAD-binding subunit